MASNEEKIKSYSYMKENRNGRSFRKYTDEFLNNADKIVRGMLDDPDITPVNEGIKAQFEDRNRYLEFVISEDAVSYGYAGIDTSDRGKTFYDDPEEAIVFINNVVKKYWLNDKTGNCAC